MFPRNDVWGGLFWWRPFKSWSSIVHVRSKGREEAVEDKDHIFIAVQIGCHGVNTTVFV